MVGDDFKVNETMESYQGSLVMRTADQGVRLRYARIADSLQLPVVLHLIRQVRAP